MSKWMARAEVPAPDRARRWLSALLCATSGCMTLPGNHGSVDGTATTVTFSGYVAAPSAVVTLEAAPASTGPFATWTSASTRSQTEGIPWQSTTFYAWSLGSTVPADRWSPFALTETCQARRTFVRAISGGLALVTFDAPAGLDALACLGAGTDVSSALRRCASADSPVVELQAKNVYVGDVVIRTAADVAMHSCDQIIRGTLSIPDSSLMTVALPLLEEVTGNLSIYLRAQPRTTVSGYDVRQVQLPRLDRVGQSLAFDQTPISGVHAGIVVPFGLDRLSRVGRDLNVRFGINGVTPTGLAGLTSLAGSLVLTFGAAIADIGAARFLQNLRSVSGSVEASNGCSVLALLDAVEGIGGALRLSRFHGCTGFHGLSNLRSVAGRVVLTDISTSSVLPALARAGAIALSNASIGVGAAGSYTVAVDALELYDSHYLGDNWRLAASARVSMAGDDIPSVTEMCSYLLRQPDYRGNPPPNLGGPTCAGLPR